MGQKEKKKNELFGEYLGVIERGKGLEREMEGFRLPWSSLEARQRRVSTAWFFASNQSFLIIFGGKKLRWVIPRFDKVSYVRLGKKSDHMAGRSELA